jgi:hypothetical protein
MISLKALLRRPAGRAKRDFQDLQGGKVEVHPVRSTGVLILPERLACPLPCGIISCIQTGHRRKRKGLPVLSCSLVEAYER